MKKLISFLLCVILTFSFCECAFAFPFHDAGVTSPYPEIFIAGDGGRIEYNDGEGLFSSSEIGKMLVRGGSGNVKEAVFNVLKPFILEGLLFDKWDNYYRALKEEVAVMYDPVAMDENGNPKEGSGVYRVNLDTGSLRRSSSAFLPEKSNNNRPYRSVICERTGGKGTAPVDSGR